jgi:methionine biosynthesis protein MetW
MSARRDLRLLADWIRPGARILDLGCGDGELLNYLREQQQVGGYGLEIDHANITACIRSGINVLELDVDAGLPDFADQSFDYVVMTEAIQAMLRPDLILDEMLRVGKQVIVTFPNFGYWRCRLQVALGGQMPLARALPHRWFDTPNIHLCTVRDFEQLCLTKRITICQREMVDYQHRARPGMRRWPNLLAEIAVYRLERAP